MSPVSPAQPPVFARTKRDFYVLIGILAFIGVAIVVALIYSFLHSPPRDDTPLWVIITVSSAIFILPNLVAFWIIGRLCLAADEHGLWIRSGFKTQFMPWRTIEDYEFRPSPNAATARGCWICHQGKWRRLPQITANMDALRARIQSQATASRAREWQLSVARDNAESWPKNYAYRDPSGRLTFALTFAGLLLYFGFAFRGAFSTNSLSIVQSIWDNLGNWGRIGFALMPFLLLGMFALWLLPMYSIMRAKKHLGTQIIRADQNALTLIDGETQTRIAWGEITDYFLEDAKGPMTLHQCAVEGAGARVVFRQEIGNYNELKALIMARAVNAASDGWRARESADSDTLGGADTLWSGGVAGVGRKIYHYRTRTTRAMLFLGGFFMLIFLVGTISSSNWRERDISDLVAGVFFLPILMLTIGGALAFWRASIQTDENGITHRSIWGERHLNWDEIESFVFYSYFYQIKGARATIRYGAVAASESLQAEIEARAGLKMRRTDRVDDDE